MELTIEEMLLIRNSLLLEIRENTKLIEGFIDLIPDNTDEFKENTKPFMEEMNLCNILIKKINNALMEKGSVL